MDSALTCQTQQYEGHLTMDTRGDPPESLGRDRSAIPLRPPARLGAGRRSRATRNEVEASDRSAERYHLYRVFGFEKNPRLFILPGSLRQTVVLDAMTYRASLP